MFNLKCIFLVEVTYSMGYISEFTKNPKKKKKKKDAHTTS